MNLSAALSNRPALQTLSGPEARQVFMGIYDNILLTSGGTRKKSYLICSANRGEGASTVALGLAMARPPRPGTSRCCSWTATFPTPGYAKPPVPNASAYGVAVQFLSALKMQDARLTMTPSSRRRG